MSESVKVSAMPSIDLAEQAARCRVLLFAVVKQALIDHRSNLKTARKELANARRKKKLPAPTDSEALAYAMQQDAAQWLLSDDTVRMTFRWCCDHAGIDPAWVRARMNRAELGFSLDHYEKKAA